MNTCEFEQYNSQDDYWWENPKYVKIKKDKVVIKRILKDGRFLDSIIVPTLMWPLVKNDFRVFTAENTHLLSRNTHGEIFKIIDSIDVEIGKCFKNADNLCKKMLNHGFDAYTYCGWRFLLGTPVAHAWVVINIDNMQSVLDLSIMDYYLYTQHGITPKSSREEVANAVRACMNVSNSIKCAPLGVVMPYGIYVGCETSTDKGMALMNRLYKEYPDHIAFKNLGPDGKTTTQRMI